MHQVKGPIFTVIKDGPHVAGRENKSAQGGEKDLAWVVPTPRNQESILGHHLPSKIIDFCPIFAGN